jgi:hypothetical protein
VREDRVILDPALDLTLTSPAMRERPKSKSKSKKVMMQGKGMFSFVGKDSWGFA